LSLLQAAKTGKLGFFQGKGAFCPGYRSFFSDLRVALEIPYYQGKSIYFLIVKISLNSPEFPRKTNHEGHKGCMKQPVIPSFCAFVRLRG
jgi:hypothetical protein